jgi:hypothetical protein
VDARERARWRKAEEVWEGGGAAVGSESGGVVAVGGGDDAKSQQDDQAKELEEQEERWKGSVGFDATTSPGAGHVELEGRDGTR